MGKLADVLEKAGYGTEGTEKQKPSQSEQPKNRSAKPVERAAPAPRTKLVRSNDNSGKWDERLFKAVNSDAYIPEIFKTLRSHILHPLEGQKVPKTIMVTSAIPKEGKSFVTANLGITLAQGMDQYALLVDCDLRRPSLAPMFGLNKSPGLADYLRDDIDLSELIVRSSVDKLSILPSGDPPVNPAELLSSAKMSSLVEELATRYDDRLIIFDSPPFYVASEATVLSRQVDGVLLVVRSGGAGKPQIQMMLDTVGEERIIGVVFNAYTTNIVERSLMKGYGYYQQSY
ncbi:polysaccharide biosynthesis tyrosine autokinase [Desulfofustis glycolicus]|uniref:Exopolysaccharide/PEP-CTERM locus tyrosine autokinase n=1 Tax=Desulfofustis glycolicus DSM 9705 TaxID=1121409 RepID=A0A1M5YLH5_9BACT|nr:polysaccharide biosynthesis tyrosine autokinase [Desulfofustis glycolicus]SHI12801.1 exopolysaccharide/PEP-CTERM locus tyrosine autokinase [Desulfofustis glycolicus DSM 9705]